MGFVKPEKFTNLPLIREAINSIAESTGYKKEIIETILDDFFVNAKKLMIEQVVDSFKWINFGRFERKKTPIEKAQLQLQKEQLLREQRLNEINND